MRFAALTAAVALVAAGLTGAPAAADDPAPYDGVFRWDPVVTPVTVDGVPKLAVEPAFIPEGTTVVSLEEFDQGWVPGQYVFQTGFTPENEPVYSTGTGGGLYDGFLRLQPGVPWEVTTTRYTPFADTVGNEGNCTSVNLTSPGTIVETGAGDDTVICVVGAIDTGDGADTVYGFETPDAQPIVLGAGDDLAFVDEGLHAFQGGASVLNADVVGDADVVAGGDGDDTVYASSGDVLSGVEHELRPTPAAAPVVRPVAPAWVKAYRVGAKGHVVHWGCVRGATSYRVQWGSHIVTTRRTYVGVPRVRYPHRLRWVRVSVRAHNEAGFGPARGVWIRR